MKMTKEIIFLIFIILFSCNTDKNKISTTKTNIIKGELKSIPLIPNRLSIKSKDHNLILNTNLFNIYELLKDSLATSKKKQNQILNENNTVSFLKKSKYLKTDIYSSNDNIDLQIKFDCKDCKDAYLFRTNGNFENISNEITDFLKDPASVEYKIPKKDNLYVYNDNKYKLKYHGFLSFYIVLKDFNDKLWIYEIAGIESDGEAPRFSKQENCLFQGNENSDGLVCITTKDFEGNTYSGYNVPLKGIIHGDIKDIYINNKKIKFIKGEFYKRIHMKLSIGYNQVPIVLIDSIGNKNETYMEIELERITNEPFIDIDNNIDLNN